MHEVQGWARPSVDTSQAMALAEVFGVVMDPQTVQALPSYEDCNLKACTAEQDPTCRSWVVLKVCTGCCECRHAGIASCWHLSDNMFIRLTPLSQQTEMRVCFV